MNFITKYINEFFFLTKPLIKIVTAGYHTYALLLSYVFIKIYEQSANGKCSQKESGAYANLL